MNQLISQLMKYKKNCRSCDDDFMSCSFEEIKYVRKQLFPPDPDSTNNTNGHTHANDNQE